MINIPTGSQLYTSIKSEIETAFGSTIPSFGKNFLRALVIAWAGILKIFYLAIAKLQKNIFVDTADPEASGGTLERFGRVKLGRNPFPAQAGKYTIQVTGTPGATIPASTTYRSNDESLNPGKLFVLDVEHILVSNPDTIIVRALEAGVGSRLEIGDGLIVTAPIANVNAPAVVTIESTEPLAAEDIEDYRQKALDAYRTEPQGGAASDYRLWAADAQGVERVYPYAKDGAAGEINLYIEATIADSTDGKGTPSAGLLTAVEAVVEFDPDTTKPLNQRGRRPLTVLQVHYLPITPLDVDIDIADFVGLTTAIRTAIDAELTLQISKIRPFISGADITSDRNDILDVNKIILAILTAAPGSIFGTVTLTVDGTPEFSHQFTEGDIPYVNLVSYSY